MSPGPDSSTSSGHRGGELTSDAASSYAVDRLGGAARLARELAALTKPGVVVLCVVTTAAGFCLAGLPLTRAAGGSPLSALIALFGTALAVAAANALNMYLERDTDRLMARTRDWPLPSGRLAPGAALLFGLGCGATALALLWLLVNPLSALLAAAALASYVLLYTPLKRRSPLALHVGAVPGALPALIGWAAARGSLDWPPLALFATLVLWQLPHFVAIAIFRAEDYERAGIKALSLGRGGFARAHRHSVAAAALLVPISVLPTPLGATGWTYLLAALVAGLWLLGVTLHAALDAWRVRPGAIDAAARAQRHARRLFVASLIYLPLLYAGIFLDTVVLRWSMR